VPREFSDDPRGHYTELWHPFSKSRLKAVVVSLGDSWDVGRDMVDVVSTRFDLDPRILMGHFDYSYCLKEANCPLDIDSRREEGLTATLYTWD
jgi:hypothetical protein